MEGLLLEFVWKGRSFLSDAGTWDAPFCREMEVKWDWIGCSWGNVVVDASLDRGRGFDVGAGVFRVVASARRGKNPSAVRCTSSPGGRGKVGRSHELGNVRLQFWVVVLDGDQGFSLFGLKMILL